MPSSSLIKIPLPVPFEDQKPGTSGLRKSTDEFFKPHYLESFIEAVLRTLPGVEGGTLIVGGDGRYGNIRAIDIILRMAAAHNVKEVVTTVNGILSTPAASNLIRSKKAIGAIILSASHNPGGRDGDFGVKINASNGGPAQEYLTEQIYQSTKQLTEYSIVENKAIPLDQSTNQYSIGSMKVNIADGVEDYLNLMQTIFDFDLIRNFINHDFLIAFDALNAVTGPYAKQLFHNLLGASQDTVRNGIPKEDFGGLHPDPNLTYASELAELLLNKNSKYSFGAACDGDGDRNMILGRNCFVNPSDSLAIIVANYKCVPAYLNGLKGVARSMPTSSAVDIVAKELGIKCYETPTGWKFFGNLLDDQKITICGEESFGTGSDHIREKDGLWAVLFWLQILADKKMSVAEVMSQHWNRFGRHYYSRHDYENISSEIAFNLYNRLEEMLPDLNGKSYAGSNISLVDNFIYIDPVDESITERQGIRIIFQDGSRILVRLSGTGTKGATLRIYFERYVPPTGDLNQDPQDALGDLIKTIDSIAEITKRTNMNEPTVIT